MWSRKGDMGNKSFWINTIRVIESRFNIYNRVSISKYKDNLSAIEKRPWNIHLELSNICNSNCVFCAYQYMTRPKTIMSDAIFNKSLDDYCDIGGGIVMLEVVVGEPTTDNMFLERIRKVRARKEVTSIETITNGILLHKYNMKELVNSGISKIKISIPAFREDIYIQVYRNPNYAKVKENVRSLLEANMASGCPVDITISFRSPISYRETLTTPDYLAIKYLQHKTEFNTDYDTWLGNIKQEDVPKGMIVRKETALSKEPCYLLYDGPDVYSDGKVGLCSCRDFNLADTRIN